MAYTYRIIELPSPKYSLKCPYTMEPEFIVIHNTYNDASAENEVAYMQRNTNSTSFHIAVDDTEAIQGLPLDRNAWHAGDGNGDGNRKGLSIEICYSKSGGTRFIAAQENAAQLTAEMLKERGWDIDRVKKHQDFSGKHCPHRTLDDYGWDYFLNLVRKYLGQERIEEEKPMRYFKIVDPTGMNMRTAPNKTKVQSIPTGAVISGTEFKTDNGVQWVYTTYNGKSGYVAVLPESKGYAVEVYPEPEKPVATCNHEIEIADLKAQIVNLDATISQKDATISELQTEIERLKSENGLLNAQHEDRVTEISNLYIQIRQLSSDNQELKAAAGEVEKFNEIKNAISILKNFLG